MTQGVKSLRKSLQPDSRSISAVTRSTGELDFTKWSRNDHAPPYALDGRSEETEGDGTPQPVHGAAIGLVPMLSKGRGQTLVECWCFLAESTTGWENKGCKRGMFNFPYSLFVHPLLLKFVFSIAFWMEILLLEGAKMLKTLMSRNDRSYITPQNPFIAISSWALSVMLAVWLAIISDVIGCSSSSIHRSIHTSVSRVVVRSLSLFWQIQGSPPFEHDSTWSREKLAPHAQLVGLLREPSHTSGIGHLQRHPNEGRSHVPQWGGMSTSLRTQVHKPGPWLFVGIKWGHLGNYRVL